MSIDQFGLPRKNSIGGTEIFSVTTGVTLQGFKTWSKPPGATLVYFLVIAGGGGGGGSPSSNNTNGGGGGGSSGITRFSCQAQLLPDVLYIQVGKGGAGGTINGNGTAGLTSYITTSPRSVATPCLIVGTNPGSGGLANGTGGNGGGISTTQPWNTLGEWQAVAGNVGTAGGTSVTPAATGINQVWSSTIVSEGTGGGGCDGISLGGGGTINTQVDMQSNNIDFYAGQAIVSAGNFLSINGSIGFINKIPFLFTGGTGGASSVAGTGGFGGDGNIGSGGGGAGCGITGNIGGKGGDGIVIITWI